MAIDAVAGSGGTSLTGSRSTIADNFDTFLSLLTTQLKHQNPLDPLDTNDFTSQMVEFTSVEQQLKTNEFLEALVLSNLSKSYTDSVAFVGKQVSASGATATMNNGQANWHYTINNNAENVDITIKDIDGNVVHTHQTSLTAGQGTFAWDGRGASGALLPDGDYTITIDARTDTGAFVPVSTGISGIVTSVDLSGSEPVLMIGETRVNLSSLTSVGLSS